MTAAKHCDECQHWRDGGPVNDRTGEYRCVKGHKPRWFRRRDAGDLGYGWKRRCEDFAAREQEKP